MQIRNNCGNSCGDSGGNTMIWHNRGVVTVIKATQKIITRIDDEDNS